MKRTTKKATAQRQVKRKATKKTTHKRVETLQAQSRQTGIVHTFQDLAVWQEIIKSFEGKHQARQSADLFTAISFNSTLEKVVLNLQPTFHLVVGTPIFRVVSTGRDPLSVTQVIAEIGSSSLKNCLIRGHKGRIVVKIVSF